MKRSPKIAYLGPAGSFSEQALHLQKDLQKADLVAYPKFTDVLQATSEEQTDLGFVAIENAIEGTVNITLDSLAFDHELLIQKEVEIAININLMALPGTNPEAIQTIYSYPVATAQCRKFLASYMPHAATKPTASTSAAAAIAATDNTAAALAPKLAAQHHGLEILKKNVADHKDNTTRFVLVGRSTIPQPTGNDKTTVVLTQHEDAPGSLIAILQEFAARGINLSRLTSRPVKTNLGNYCFIIDFEGHIGDDVVADCLKSIHANHATVKLLGSYPSCSTSTVEQTQTDQKRVAAQKWINNLQNKIEQG